MAGLTDNNMKSGIRTGADENNPSLFFIAAGLVFYRLIGDCQNRKQEDLFP